jgi:hypothetical protein
MRLGNFNLTLFSSALLCFASVLPRPAEAIPQRLWPADRSKSILRVVNGEAKSDKTPAKEAARKIEQAYLSRLTKEGATITLRGHVPSETDLKILQGVAAATSPGASVVDKSRVNTNVGDRDIWLAAMTFALRQLSKLQSGQAVLKNAGIVIEGVTSADDDFAAVQKKVRDEAPRGLTVEVALRPHDVHPFVWIAQLRPGAVDLRGYVPDRQDQVLYDHAQGLFQNLKVNNGMEFAKGEPQDWLAATKVALEMLSLLYAGNVSMSDTEIKIDGIYSSPAMVDLLKTYSRRLPRGFTLVNTVLEPVAKAPAPRAEDVSLASQESRASMNP